MTATKSKPGSWWQAGWQSWQRPVPVAPLVTFRILFGVMMLASIIRFWLKGWITELYVKPDFYFPYPGFEWVRPLGDTGMHLLFGLMAAAALLVALGWYYRVACLLFFLSFTYVELIDSTNYLNHYYFVSLVSFLLIWLPANRQYSLDSYFNPPAQGHLVPLWMVGVVRLQLALVYVFAGLAKLHPDWLLQALPLRIWLPAKTHLPLIGSWLYEPAMAYLMSWFGAFYDLFIVFFLLNRKTRPWAYFFVVVFHLATALLFPGIGMFPYIMIVSSLVFCSSAFHQRLLGALFRRQPDPARLNGLYAPGPLSRRLCLAFFSLYFLIQVLVPLRFLLYPGNLFWQEEGFRFSWRVMLMEKSGNTFFYVKEAGSGKTFEVNNREFLTPLQEKMMSTQPDMLLQFAHHLAAVYARRGVRQPAVYAESYVSLNGRRSRLFTDTTVNLAQQPLSWKHYPWVLPFQNPDN